MRILNHEHRIDHGVYADITCWNIRNGELDVRLRVIITSDGADLTAAPYTVLRNQRKFTFNGSPSEIRSHIETFLEGDVQHKDIKAYRKAIAYLRSFYY